MTKADEEIEYLIPEDLRIGNLVMVTFSGFLDKEHNGERAVAVESIDSDGINIEINSSYYGDWEADYDAYFGRGGKIWGTNYKPPKGILISEEWLLKFGFEKEGEYNFKMGVHGCWQDGTNNQWYFVWKERRHLQNKFYKTIQYVHQLQNLFWALTGEELEIKIP